MVFRSLDGGDPTEDVLEALETLRKAGYRIVIHFCRTSFKFKSLLIDDQLDRIREYMKYYKLPFDDAWVPDKPIRVVYIDDRAISFSNNWKDITEKLILKSKKYK